MTVARRVGYLLVAAAITAFAVALGLLVLVESVGPSTRAEGRVLGTASGIVGGFLCFPARAAGGVLSIPLGTSTFEAEYRAAYAAGPG